MAAAAAGCGSVPEEEGPQEPATTQAESHDDALTGAELVAAYAAYKKYKGYLDTARSFWNSAQGFLDPPRDLAAELDELKARVSDLEGELRRMATDLIARIDTVEFQARDNLVKSWRAQVQSALQYASAGRDTESMAHGAANALENWDLYHYTARYPGLSVRFDPRLAVLSFMEAVNTWIAVRAILKRPMDGHSRGELWRFIGRLEAVAGNTASRMSCENLHYTDVKERHLKPGLSVPVYSCRYVRRCTDLIEKSHVEDPNRRPAPPWGVTSEDLARPTNGECSAEQLQQRSDDPAAAHRKSSDGYFLGAVEETAAIWREVANS